MPSASDELRAEMRRRFGDIDTGGPEKYLTDRGWTLTKGWEWSKAGQNMHTMPRDEFECAMFLMHEWDYGTILNGVPDARE
jgi:hypothetical protein